MANHPGICPILPDNSSSINSFKSGFMALLPILRYPDPRLHKKAAPVKQVDARVRKLAADMAETFKARQEGREPDFPDLRPVHRGM